LFPTQLKPRFGERKRAGTGLSLFQQRIHPLIAPPLIIPLIPGLAPPLMPLIRPPFPHHARFFNRAQRSDEPSGVKGEAGCGRAGAAGSGFLRQASN
jgi:hypothetical protein